MTNSALRNPVGRRRGLPITLLILFNITIGMLVVRHYGMTWDEPGNYEYGEFSLANYSRVFQGLPHQDFPREGKNSYGPAFLMFGALLVQVATFVRPELFSADVWHFSYFLAFQLAVLSLYLLSWRWMGGWASFGVALLFCTQPVLWGHAFINPKDIPFMAFFLASVAAGFAMVDRVSSFAVFPGSSSVQADYSPGLQQEWKSAAPQSKRRILGGTASLGIYILFAATQIPAVVVSKIVTISYSAQDSSWLGSLFHHLTQNSGLLPVQSYVHKALRILLWGEIALALFGIVAILWVSYRVFPNTLEALVKSKLLPLGGQFLKGLTSPIVLLAGTLLGITASIRVLGPFAGALVGLYAFTSGNSKRMLGTLLSYFAIAAMVGYLTWPFLWGSPLKSLWQSLRVMSAFPFRSQVLFEGSTIRAPELPPIFLPKMIAIQLTGAALLLCAAGIVIAVWGILHHRRGQPLALLMVWFLIPLGGIILMGSTVYDGFRQVFFLIPPMFIVAGLALDWIFSRLASAALRVLVLILLVAPGIYSIITLHPYEYIYYNGFVGGVRGAFRQFELDYWGVSYREAALFVNQIAPRGAGVLVYGPSHVYKPYSRADIKVYDAGASESGDLNNRGVYEFAVIYDRNNLDLFACKGAEPLMTIERAGAVLAVVKRILPGQDNCP